MRPSSEKWTTENSSIGSHIDSYYEYLLKAYVLFGDEESLFMFEKSFQVTKIYIYIYICVLVCVCVCMWLVAIMNYDF